MTIRFGLHDSCSRNITGMTDINITMRSTLTGSIYNCTTVLDEGNGVYNCTFNTTSNPDTMPSRGYSFEILSNKQYYNNDNETQTYVTATSGFFIDTAPVLQYPQLNTSAFDGDTGENGSWSENRNFTINVTDEDGDQVTVRLWKRYYDTGTGWDPWEIVDTQYPSAPNNIMLTFEEDKNDYNPPGDLGTWQYKFNATDQSTNPDPLGGTTYTDQINGTNYTVEKDDMQINYSYGSDVTMWRNGTDTQILSVIVFSIDQNRLLAQQEAMGVVWITKNGTDFLNVTSMLYGDAIKTLTGGYLNMSPLFNPDCTYDVGVQYWKIGIMTNDEFKDLNSSDYFNVTLETYLNGTIITPDGGAYIKAASNNVPFNITVFDECSYGVENLDSTNISIDVEGSAPEVSNYSITEIGNGYYFNNWSTMDVDDLGMYNMTFRASEQYYVDLYLVKNEAFWLTATITLENFNPFITTDDDGGWGEEYQFWMRAIKADGLPFNISLWFKKNNTANWELLEKREYTASGWNNSDDNNHFKDTFFSCGDITPGGESATYKFNATDQFGFGTEIAGSGSFWIVRDNVSINYINGSGAIINREGSYYNPFIVTINDTDRNSVGVGNETQGKLYVTVDNVNYLTEYINTTDNTSKFIIDFDPNCTHGYGQQKWIGGTFNDTCYFDKNTTVSYPFTVKGQLKNNI
ncbi:MAG: hypothetical protein KAS32_21570, partial [Candidatus Peribacteraceae bacterium]|nr:hypothetical protein [Candidatus Peribacteraceae bacterium]